MAKIARTTFIVTFAIFAIFADISGPFLTSSLSKSGILLHLLFLRCLRYLALAFQASKKNLVIFAIFAIFADISGPFLNCSFSKSRILLHLLFLRFLRYLSWVFLASKKNPCYICDFCDICGHFGALLGFFFF